MTDEPWGTGRPPTPGRALPEPHPLPPTPLWVPAARAESPVGDLSSIRNATGSSPPGPDFAAPPPPYRTVRVVLAPVTPTPSGSRRPTWVGVIAVGVAIVLSLVTIGAANRLLGGAAVAGASPSGRAPVSYEPRTRPATPAPETTPPVATASSNPLYAQKLAGTCARPPTDKTWAGVQRSIRTEAECLDRMWQPVVEAAGGHWAAPTLLFYADPIAKSPCGPSPDKEKAPAHYCPGNRTVYVSDAVADSVIRYRLIGFEVIAHEYTHHVQELAGILAQANAMGRGDAVTRRVELQAHCVAYSSMVAMTGLEVTTRELDQLRNTWKYAGDPAGHGSAQAQTYWGERGINAASLGECDTFSAPDDLVT